MTKPEPAVNRMSVDERRTLIRALAAAALAHALAPESADTSTPQERSQGGQEAA